MASAAAKNADAVDREARFPAEAFQAAREQRLLDILVPTDLGGEEASISDVVDVCYVLGRVVASTAMSSRCTRSWLQSWCVTLETAHGIQRPAPGLHVISYCWLVYNRRSRRRRLAQKCLRGGANRLAHDTDEARYGDVLWRAGGRDFNDRTAFSRCCNLPTKSS